MKKAPSSHPFTPGVKFLISTTMELVEREQFLQELEAIFRDVVGGQGRFVLVSGEAGIG